MSTLKFFAFPMAFAMALVTSFAAAPPSFAQTLPAQNSVSQKLSLRFQDTPLPTAIELLAQRMNLRLELGPEVKGTVTYNFEETPFDDILQTIAQDHKLDYKIESGSLYVAQLTEGETAAPLDFSVRRIPVQNNTAEYVLTKLPKFLQDKESIITDDSSNSLILYGSSETQDRLQDFVDALDILPKQIMIQAQIVETSKNFSRDIGFLWGHTNTGNDGGQVTDGTSVSMATAIPALPVLSLRTLMSAADGRRLQASILAAEDRGDARVLSKPRVVTINNNSAVIRSGITFHVKTLTTEQTETESGTENVTGGVQQITAGLNLTVLPVVIGKDMIRLSINVSNSEPNHALSVDNIPGITDNSANASIIVRDGNTATMAGLIKSSLSESRNGVPWLSSIPLLGWFFRSHSNLDRNTELMILITPTILDDQLQAPEVSLNN